MALAACGGSDPSSSTSSTTTTPAPPPKETREGLPDRPEQWTRYVNERGGYALLLPRGWEGERDGPQTLIRSFDRLVAISIAPDRSAAAAETPIEDYATNTAERLRGFEHGFEPEGTRRFPGHYEAVDVYGTGRSRDGVEQRVSVIVLRRDELATSHRRGRREREAGGEGVDAPGSQGRRNDPHPAPRAPDPPTFI